ncbi:MAG: FAD-binding oxidoreductase [bacterium]
MEVVKPQKYLVRLSDKYYLTDNQRFLYLKFELVQPNEMMFQAGQYTSIKINEQGERRSYSIASMPDETHGFHLLAEVVDGGRGSDFLKRIEVGAEMEILAPMGRFVVTGREEKLLFVGTGTGIVPLWSMINDLLINKHETKQIRLHWGMRSEEDLFFVDNLERLVEEHSNFVFDIVLSKPTDEWELCSGHVQDCLTRDFPEGMGGWEAYVCGRKEVTMEIVDKLEAMGIAKENIHNEKFT